jgi:ketosteroid isomerase-like protein
MAQFIRAWEDAWEEMEYEPEEWLEDGDAVIVVVRYRGRGKGSGVTVDDRFAWRYEFGGDRTVGWGIYATKADALEAAGLRG